MKKPTLKKSIRTFIKYFKPNTNPVYTFPPKSEFKKYGRVPLYFTYTDAKSIEKVVNYLEKLL